MKNIRSSKGQDGFIGALLGLIVIGFVAYMMFVSLFFAVAVPMAINYDNEKEVEERAQYTDLEWIQKEGYDAAQLRYCSKDPNRQYDTFSCTDTIEEWSKTPSAKKVILKGLHSNAKGEWMTENVYYIIQPSNGFEVARYPSMSKVACNYAYEGRTYKCDPSL